MVSHRVCNFYTDDHHPFINDLKNFNDQSNNITNLDTKHILNQQQNNGKYQILNTHDLTATRREWYITPPHFITKLIVNNIKDKRDLPICYLLLNVIFITLPCAILVF